MSEPDEKFELTQGEKLSPVWARLKKHLQDELTVLRARNDSLKLTEAETAALRGNISRIKALLALDEDRPQTETLG